MQATLTDLQGNGDDHWTVVWVETASGTFIKTLWKQGPSSFTSSGWRNHCRKWWDAKGSSTEIDGFTGATARNYSGANSPVLLTWDCRDADSNLVADGDYKFWIQYAEDTDHDGLGPYTTDGLTWTKGASSVTNTYPNQTGFFSGMSVEWTAIAPPPVAPTIGSGPPTGIGIVGVPYQFTSTATGTAPIGFFATGLPSGLTMSEAGVITGIPTAIGTFSGTLTATNGTPPDATQPFSVVISEVPTTIATMKTQGLSLVLEGSGPTNGVYSLKTTTDLTLPVDQWLPSTTGTFDATGTFSVTNTPNAVQSPLFYQLSIP